MTTNKEIIMHKFMLGTALLPIVLGGCATISGGSGPTAAQVEGAAVALCSYLPTADSVAALLSANGAIMTAEAIAQIICTAVGPVPTTQSGRFKATAPVTVLVNGKPVTVTGSFVAAVKGNRVK
jgi:hypothetical protein